MRATAARDAPTSGSVHRVSGNLVVELPADMPASTRRTLENQLLMHACAVVDNGLFTVPAPHAHKLTEVLSRPWPAGRWDWDWSTAARASSANAEAVHQAVLRLLDAASPSSAQVDKVLARLVAGGFTRTLLPAQIGAVAALVHAEGGGNFSVPGSGKTTMTFAAYVALREIGVVSRMLVVAPQSAYEAWLEESQDCFEPDHRPSIELAPTSPRRPTEVVVLNYERAAQGSTRAAIDGWSRGRPLLVVFVLIENVPTVRHDISDVVGTTRTHLEKRGYVIAEATVALHALGVAQRRKRHVLLASRVKEIMPDTVLRELTQREPDAQRNLRWAIADLATRTSSSGYDAPPRASEKQSPAHAVPARQQHL